MVYAAGLRDHMRQKGGQLPARDMAIFGEMMTHPGLIAGATPGIVAVVAAEAPSAVLCEILKYRSVRKVLLFPPWDQEEAAEARLHSEAKLNEGFYKQWKCADDARVHLTQWTSPEASENERHST